MERSSDPILLVRGCALRHPHGDGFAGSMPDLDLLPGECVLLCGPSGSGKTTFLLAAAGLLEPGRVAGRVERFPHVPEGRRDAPGRTGIVLQNPETQLLCATVREEAAFGPRNMGLDETAVAERVERALGVMGLAAVAERPVEALSMGQKHRLALAATLAMEPRLLLLDEPFTQLDPQGRAMLADVVRGVCERGGAVVVSEHVPEFMDGLDARRVDMTHLDAFSPPDAAMDVFAGLRPAYETPLDVRGLTCGYRGMPPILRGVDLGVPSGAKVLVRGANGGGKSTLLKAVVGALTPSDGEVRVCGARVTHPAALFGKVGFLGQNPEAQVFEDTVRDEIAFSLCRCGLSRGDAVRRACAILEAFGLAELADRPPLALSFGQKHLVALAAMLAPGPGLVLLDEPFTGLAASVRDAVLAILDGYARATGAGVLMVSHDPRCPGWADVDLVLRDGCLASDCAVDEVGGGR
ncbi:energy-coupling factor transport system ATP-binding protein [Desulfobaculum xiamenense]|uniref:Energy-coupling factor transport system ATP-binding protein n=1 Tax=Desulfobaculum xiamenense TaxID=995050 RepID=A0A846QKL2_9BACT|nr:ABC transporter ATP-binding protein [Desulfobaculum xiamenense]NJB68728.1 energy-coupling factor transport system ATP-binding protein [Desulfobaculum xiamenense]